MAIYGTIIRGIRNLGLQVPLSNRMKYRLGKKLELIRNDLRAGVPKTEIMKNYDCAEETLILIELDKPNLIGEHRLSVKTKTRDRHRSTVLNFIKQFPDSGRSMIFKELPTCYEYLLREDKEWFYAQFPNRKKVEYLEHRRSLVEWSLIDEQKFRELELVVARLYGDVDKPVWVSMNRLLKGIGLHNKYRNDHSRFPKIEALLARCAESYEEFVIRKASWRQNKS